MLTTMLVGSLAAILTGLALSQARPSAARPDDREARLVGEVLNRALAPGVEAVQLVPQAGRALYRAALDGVLVELHTNVDPATSARIASEVMTRMRRSPMRGHIIVASEVQDSVLAVEMHRNRVGWVITARRAEEGSKDRPLIGTVLSSRVLRSTDLA